MLYSYVALYLRIVAVCVCVSGERLSIMNGSLIQYNDSLQDLELSYATLKLQQTFNAEPFKVLMCFMIYYPVKRDRHHTNIFA